MHRARQRMFARGGRVRNMSAKKQPCRWARNEKIPMTRLALTLGIVLLFVANSAWPDTSFSERAAAKQAPGSAGATTSASSTRHSGTNA
jgi:hypothetical protein